MTQDRASVRGSGWRSNSGNALASWNPGAGSGISASGKGATGAAGSQFASKAPAKSAAASRARVCANREKAALPGSPAVACGTRLKTSLATSGCRDPLRAAAKKPAAVSPVGKPSSRSHRVKRALSDSSGSRPHAAPHARRMAAWACAKRGRGDPGGRRLAAGG